MSGSSLSGAPLGRACKCWSMPKDWCCADGSLASCSAVVGEVDDEIDSQIDFNELRAVPLKPVSH